MAMRNQHNNEPRRHAWGVMWMPWTNAAGQFSMLRFVVCWLLLLPALLMAYKYASNLYSPKFITDLIRDSGDWSLRLLVISLAITPFALLLTWPALIDVRRMVGLSSLYYALLHIVFYCVDQNWIWLTIVQEMVSRLFLSIGVLATCGLLVLGVTSNELSVRRLGGRRWNKIHRCVYATTVLGLLHYFMEVRLDAYEAVLLTGFFLILMVYRLLRAWRWTIDVKTLIIISCAMACLTAVIEASYYGLATRFGFWRVFMANADLVSPFRPALWVALGGLCASALVAARSYFIRRV
jgi:methionine sulfoxide reductase heme-binding subunit